MTTDSKKQEALDFLKTHRTGVLATISPQHTPRARLVYYASDDDFKIYFLTLANTRKADDIAQNPHGAFVVALEDLPKTIQVEGMIEDLSGTQEVDPVVSKLFENLKSNATYGAPLARFDVSEVRFYCLTPTYVRFGDFTTGHSTGEVMTTITG